MKKTIIFGIVLFLLLANFPVGIEKNIAQADGEIQITTWAELHAIRNNLAGDYILMNDLDETTAGYDTYASSIANAGAGWDPIGTVGVDAQFAGSFDGNNHTISGLYIDRPTTDIIGLFGYTNVADIRNLSLEDVNIVGHGYVGALVGYNLNSSISTSTSSGDITCTENYAGSLIGGNNGSSISNSYSTGSVSGNDYVGGLVGYSFNNASISNSYSAGSVSGSNRIGGLVGHNDNTISNSYSIGSVSGTWYVGGLVGLNYGPISNSYSTGLVLDPVNYFGGLVGGQYGGSINYSFWDIDTSGQETSAGGTGKTTAEMKTLVTFTTELGANSWDFAATWAMGNERNSGYPYLQSIPPFAIWTLTYTAGENGSITGDSPQTVNGGENGTAVEAIPDEGYVFVNWSDNSTSNPRTDSNVAEDITVTANFAIDEVDTPEEEVLPELERAKINSWSVEKYTDPNKSCSERLKLTIKGEHFDNDAKVFIGGKEASSVDVKNSKKLTAKFCLDKLLDSKTNHKKIIYVENPDTKKTKAKKQIDLDNILPEFSANDFNPQSPQSIKDIQAILVKLGYLDSQYITGFYGSITTEAIKKFQADNGIEATGFVGPLTRDKLGEKNK